MYQIKYRICFPLEGVGGAANTHLRSRLVKGRRACRRGATSLPDSSWADMSNMLKEARRSQVLKTEPHTGSYSDDAVPAHGMTMLILSHVGAPLTSVRTNHAPV